MIHELDCIGGDIAPGPTTSDPAQNWDGVRYVEYNSPKGRTTLRSPDHRDISKPASQLESGRSSRYRYIVVELTDWLAISQREAATQNLIRDPAVRIPGETRRLEPYFCASRRVAYVEYVCRNGGFSKARDLVVNLGKDARFAARIIRGRNRRTSDVARPCLSPGSRPDSTVPRRRLKTRATTKATMPLLSASSTSIRSPPLSTRTRLKPQPGSHRKNIVSSRSLMPSTPPTCR